jgi:hypothetical protein
MKAPHVRNCPRIGASFLKQCPCHSINASAVGPREPEKPHAVGQPNASRGGAY